MADLSGSSRGYQLKVPAAENPPMLPQGSVAVQGAGDAVGSSAAPAPASLTVVEGRPGIPPPSEQRKMSTLRRSGVGMLAAPAAVSPLSSNSKALARVDQQTLDDLLEMLRAFAVRGPAAGKLVRKVEKLLGGGELKLAQKLVEELNKQLESARDAHTQLEGQLQTARELEVTALNGRVEQLQTDNQRLATALESMERDRAHVEAEQRALWASEAEKGEEKDQLVARLEEAYEELRAAQDALAAVERLLVEKRASMMEVAVQTEDSAGLDAGATLLGPVETGGAGSPSPPATLLQRAARRFKAWWQWLTSGCFTASCRRLATDD